MGSVLITSIISLFVFAADGTHGEKRAKVELKPENDFQCVPSGRGNYQPQSTLARKDGSKCRARGRAGFSLEACQRAIQNARNNVVCTNTLIGWKPTFYTGWVQSRAGLGNENHGFFGISLEGRDAFSDCLKATRHSTAEKVCFFNGGGEWYGAKNAQANSTVTQKFGSVEACLDHINPKWREDVK